MLHRFCDLRAHLVVSQGGQALVVADAIAPRLDPERTDGAACIHPCRLLAKSVHDCILLANTALPRAFNQIVCSAILHHQFVSSRKTDTHCKLHEKVKVVVVNKNDAFLFDRFIDRIQGRDIHELKIAENFQEFIGENVNDEGLNVEDTYQLVEDYIDGVDTDLEKDRIKASMRELMTEAQALEIA